MEIIYIDDVYAREVLDLEIERWLKTLSRSRIPQGFSIPEVIIADRGGFSPPPSHSFAPFIHASMRFNVDET